MAAGFLTVKGIFEGFKKTVDYNVELGRQSRILEVPVEQLDAYDRAIRRIGGHTGDFESLLHNLSEKFNIAPNKIIQVIPQLSKLLHDANRFYAFYIGHQLNLTDPEILFLRQGPRKVDEDIERQKKLGVTTAESVEQATKYNNEISELDTSISKLQITLATPILPYLTDFFKKLTELVEEWINIQPALKDSFKIIQQNFKFRPFEIDVPFTKKSEEKENKNINDVVSMLSDISKDKSPFYIPNLENLNMGKYLLKASADTPLNYQTSNAINNSNSKHFERNNVINTGEITINTQANDEI